MSRSNAAAINRRVNIPSSQTSNPISGQKPSQSTQSAPTQTQQPPQASGFTLPQVIAVIDSRLVSLEKFMKESQSRPVPQYNESSQQQNLIISNDASSLSTFIEEFNARFDLVAEEMSNMKDVILKLQSYTMDVNKMLLDERIHVFSDLSCSNEVNVDENDENTIPTLSITDSTLVNNMSDEFGSISNIYLESHQN